MIMFTTLWNRIRRRCGRRATVGAIIFVDGSCERVVETVTTHQDRPPAYQVYYSFGIEEPAFATFVDQDAYQVLVHPTPPTTLNLINRVLQMVYTWRWFRTPTAPPATPLRFRETRAYAHPPHSTFRTFTPIPPASQPILYWRPVWGRWFLHVGTVTAAKLTVLEYQDTVYQHCWFTLANGHAVDSAHVYQDALPPELFDLRYTYIRTPDEELDPAHWVSSETTRHMASWFA